jgi:hypothetical protein
MRDSATTSSRPALTGNAKGFMAARRRRRQEIAMPPMLRWERLVAPASGSALHADGTPIWVVRLINEGGEATGTSVVLFTADVVIRDQGGELGVVGSGERWDWTLSDLEARPPHPVWGYALALAGDGRWFASTVDGRTASFRTKPDELGVLRTLGLRMGLGVEPHDGPVRSERVAAATSA